MLRDHGPGIERIVADDPERGDPDMGTLILRIAPGARLSTIGDGIENAFPRVPMDAVLCEVFPVVGRVRDGAPSEITVTGVIDGAEFTETIALEVGETEATTDLRLRWAAERLRQMRLFGIDAGEDLDLEIVDVKLQAVGQSGRFLL